MQLQLIYDKSYRLSACSPAPLLLGICNCTSCLLRVLHIRHLAAAREEAQAAYAAAKKKRAEQYAAGKADESKAQRTRQAAMSMYNSTEFV